MAEKKWVSLEPTPEGLVQIEKIFRDTLERSEKIIVRCGLILDRIDVGAYVDVEGLDIEFLIEALEAYVSQERKRIINMEDGLHAMGKERVEEHKESSERSTALDEYLRVKSGRPRRRRSR